MNDQISTHQIKLLPAKLADMAEHYSDAVDQCSAAEPTFIPLRILTLIDEINNATRDTDNLMDVAIEKLPPNTDSDPAESVLKGAKALNLHQSERIWDLTGLMVRYMQLQAQGAPNPPPQCAVRAP